jgi:hypothetical protein
MTAGEKLGQSRISPGFAIEALTLVRLFNEKLSPTVTRLFAG